MNKEKSIIDSNVSDQELHKKLFNTMFVLCSKKANPALRIDTFFDLVKDLKDDIVLTEDNALTICRSKSFTSSEKRAIIKKSFIDNGKQFTSVVILYLIIDKIKKYPSRIKDFRTLMNKYFDYEHTDQEAFVNVVCNNTTKLALLYDIIAKKTKHFKKYDVMILAFESNTEVSRLKESQLMMDRLNRSKPHSRTDWYNFPPELLSRRTRRWDSRSFKYQTYAERKFDIEKIAKNLTERLPEEYEKLFDLYLPREYFTRFDIEN